MNEPLIPDESLLDAIKKAAANLATIPEIAILLMIDETYLREQVNIPGSPIHQAYFSGKIKTSLDLRLQEIQLAMSGSPQAVERTAEYINSMNDSELL